MLYIKFSKIPLSFLTTALCLTYFLVGDQFKINANDKLTPTVACDFYKISSHATFDVKSNDVEVEDHELITTKAPLHGTLASASGYYFYTPNEGYSGSDEFNYKGCLQNQCTESAVVKITVER